MPSPPVPADTVVDGEIVAFDHGQTSFERLQGRIGLHDPDAARATGIAVYRYLFDIPVLDGHDVTALWLSTRKRLLRDAVDFGDPLRMSPHRSTDGQVCLQEAWRRGWEGLVATRADGPTDSGGAAPIGSGSSAFTSRSSVIGGWTDPQGSRTGFGALLVGYCHDRDLRYAGMVGSGFVHRVLADLSVRFRDLSADRSAFAEPVREKRAHWLRPELIAQIGFSEWTRDGKLRHPRHLGLRDDKAPEDVVREEPALRGWVFRPASGGHPTPMRPFDQINCLERAEWLDRPAAAARSLVQRVLRHRGVKDVLHGVWLGHPLHPGVAQFALGSFTSAALLDAVGGPRSGSTRLIAAGLAAALPSAVSGWADYAEAHEDQQRVGVVHAASNATAVALFSAALVARARGGSGRLASVAGGAIASFGAVLGGHMGYRQALGANHAEDVTHIGPAEWQPLGPIAELPEGGPVRRRAGRVDVVVVRRGAQVTVLADRCPHLSAPLSDGDLVETDGETRLVCPWHGSRFRLDDGCVVHGPATASVPRFETRTVGQSVEARVVPIPGVEALHDPPPRDLQHDLAVANDADTGVLRHADG